MLEHVRTSRGIITAGAIIVQLATNYLTPTDAASHFLNNHDEQHVLWAWKRCQSVVRVNRIKQRKHPRRL